MALTKRDWTLLAIAAAEGEPLSPVQLQKALFLLGQMRADRIGGSFYHFEPYNYGPFDATIYRDAETLASDGMVSINDGKWKEYSVTPKGAAIASRIASSDQDSYEYLTRAVKWIRSIPFQELVKAIYARFPEYRVRSVFQY